MDHNKEQESNTANLVFDTNTLNDELNPHLAAFEVLKALGFTIEFEGGATDSSGRPLEDRLRVMVSKDERPKIDTMFNLFFDLPENKIFFDAFEGLPFNLGKALNNKSTDFPTEWVREHQKLLERALKTAYLRAAEREEKLTKLESDFSAEAQLDRTKAAAIQEPGLDPEGIRVILREQARTLLEQHPDLRPENYHLGGVSG